MSKFRVIVMLVLAAALGWSFWRSGGWLQLCAGLALFLFGMQCLEEGLRQLAGGRLEQMLARSTGTRGRALLFGIGGTVLLQSSTLVSLLTIAFISSGLIQLAGGIAVILGANLGATSGIWLLALAGQDLSLSPLALPLLVFGVLAGFTGPRGKAAGRVVLGVAFIFLGIDQIKDGFAQIGGGIDMSGMHGGTLWFVLAGIAITVVLQSSHATLMLTLAALAGGQLQLEQGLAIAIGSNVGSSVSTAFVGMLGGNRSGQRLALAHALFNVVTALAALLLLAPLTWLVETLAGFAGFGDNPMLQLALFHTLFNAGGVALFWPWQAQLATALERWLPEHAGVAASDAHAIVTALGDEQPGRALHLSGPALESVDAAAAAVLRELRHLGQICLELTCRALCLPPEQLVAETVDEALVRAPPQECVDLDSLYRQRMKGVYGDLLDFMGRLDAPLDEEHQRFWTQAQMAALQMAKVVKDAGGLQLNLSKRLAEPDSPLREAYVDIRRHLLSQLRAFHALGRDMPENDGLAEHMASLEHSAELFGAMMREQLFAMVRRHAVDGLQAGSLMNDLGYVDRILDGLREVLSFDAEPESLRRLRRSADDVAAASQQPAISG